MYHTSVNKYCLLCLKCPCFEYICEMTSFTIVNIINIFLSKYLKKVLHCKKMGWI